MTRTPLPHLERLLDNMAKGNGRHIAEPVLQPVITVTAAVEVPFKRITDCITGAIEGGSGYWCNDFLPSPDCEIMKHRFQQSGLVWYDEVAYWNEGGKAALAFDPPTDDHPGTATIGKVQLENGLNIFATKYPRHFADLMAENDDAGTHDLFLQCVLFGEEVFA